MNFLCFLIEPVFPWNKKSQLIGIDPGFLIIAVLPDETSFLPVLCNGGIPDHGLVFVYRVHIKQKDSVGIQVIVHQGKYMLQFLFLCYVIQAVAHADNRSYGSV